MGIARQLLLLLLVHTVAAFTAVVPFKPRTLKPGLMPSRTATTTTTTTTSTEIAFPLRVASPAIEPTQDVQSTQKEPMSKLSYNFTKFGMMLFVVTMCVALPATLLPQVLLKRLGLISRVKSERWALATGQFCARWLHRLIPFCSIETISHDCFADDDADDDDNTGDNAYEPSVWVCNHTSMLDVFILLAADLRLRGPHKRPLKVVYWKQLEDNPVTKLLFQQSGFIPVQMAANASGEENQYDRSSFKTLLSGAKKAFEEGFDIGILPEGQLNPHPEEGLLPIYGGAYSLARMAKRPIQMIGLHGVHELWHPIHGMEPTNNRVKVRMYPHARNYKSPEEFEATFTKVIGHFGRYGTDVPNLEGWLNGDAFQEEQQQQQQQES